jgi:hypothetical protein
METLLPFEAAAGRDRELPKGDDEQSKSSLFRTSLDHLPVLPRAAGFSQTTAMQLILSTISQLHDRSEYQIQSRHRISIYGRFLLLL